VKGDDIPLSPAYGGDRIFIAVHAYHRMPYQTYFRGIEEIFQAYEGRPHWGKMHTASEAYLEKVYPELPRFLALCEQYDPHGLFRTPYFRGLLWGEKRLERVSSY
jgi:FAD/FMN-containing dehydrogenase